MFFFKRKRSSKSRTTSTSVKNKKPKKIVVSAENFATMMAFIPKLGYLILTLTCLDYIFLLSNSEFFNPNWEMSLIGRMVEYVWSILIAFFLIFVRYPEHKIRESELFLLSWLSRLILLISILYFLCIPLIISNTVRIRQQNYVQYSAQLENNEIQIKEVESQVSKMSEEQMIKSLSRSQNNNLQDSPIIIKQKLLSQLKQENDRQIKQFKTAYKQQNKTVLKNAIKWGIGSLLSGIVLLGFWNATAWTRGKVKVSSSPSPSV